MNDEFFISTSYVKSFQVLILNCWEEKVYEYDDINGYWDGRLNGNRATEGVYFVKYEIEGLNSNLIIGQGTIQVVY